MKKILLPLFLILFGSLFYLAILKGSPGNPLIGKIPLNLGKAPGPFESSHERAPYAQIVAFTQSNTTALSKKLADFSSPDTVIYNGKFYNIFPPGLSLIATPFYIWGKNYGLAQLVTYYGMALFAVFNLLLLYAISKNIFKLSHSISTIVALLFGFGSTALSYSATLYQHQLSTALVLLGFYSAWKLREEGWKQWVWSAFLWITAGISIWVDYPNGVFFIPVFLLAFSNSSEFQKSRSKINLKFSLGFIVTSVFLLGIVYLHGVYNQRNFGSWKVFPQVLGRYDTTQERKTLKEKAKESKTKKPYVYYGIGNIVREEQLPRGLYILSVAPDKGLFFFTPVLALALFGLLSIFKKRKAETIALVSVAALNIAFYSSFGDPWGGWAYGPRYLILSMAVLSPFVGVWLSGKTHQILRRILFFVLFAFSSAVAILGAVTTNQTPPKVEADFMKISYGYFHAWEFFRKQETAGFIFNNYAYKYVSLQNYALILWGSLLLVVLLFLFIPLLISRLKK